MSWVAVSHVSVSPVFMVDTVWITLKPAVSGVSVLRGIQANTVVEVSIHIQISTEKIVTVMQHTQPVSYPTIII